MPTSRSQVSVCSSGSMLGRALTLRGRGNDSFTNSRGIPISTVMITVISLCSERELEIIRRHLAASFNATNVIFLCKRVH